MEILPQAKLESQSIVQPTDELVVKSEPAIDSEAVIKKQPTIKIGDRSLELCPEAALLLNCAIPLTSATASSSQALLVHIDWHHLGQLASQQGMIPPLYWHLKAISPSQIPQATWLQLQQQVQTQFQTQFQTNVQRNLLLTQELLQLLALFQANRIDVLPFKGPLLTQMLYGDLSRRRISDLDLLVHPDDLPTAIDLLLQRGYQIRNQVRWECHLIRQDGVLNIDLHQQAVPAHLCYPLTNDYWWQQRQSFQLAGTPVTGLSIEATFLMLCLNGTKDQWVSLNRIRDVAELIRAYPELNWSALMQQAKQLGYQRLIALALILAVELLEAPVPAAIWQQVSADRAAYFLAIQVTQALFWNTAKPYREVSRTLFHIQTRERVSDRIQCFIGLMHHSGWLTPTEKDRAWVVLPPALSWLYYLIRPIRVINRYGLGSLRQLVLGR